MTDKQYQNIMQFAKNDGGLFPANQLATEFSQNFQNGEIVFLTDAKKRDITFHKFYFALLKFVYGYLPKSFTEKVPESKFYNFLKFYFGKYKVILKFKNGKEFIELDSISFSKMNNQTFEIYVKNQLPDIYLLIESFYPENYKAIIETIEQEFNRKLIQLFANNK